MYCLKKIIALLVPFVAEAQMPFVFPQDDFTNHANATLLDGRVNYGIGLNLHVELLQYIPQFRLSITAGVGYAFLNQWSQSGRAPLYGSYHAEVDVFRGGLGSSLSPTGRSKMMFELRQTAMINAGMDYGPQDRGRPLVQFVGNAAHPLIDPYRSSFGLGAVVIHGLNYSRSQQVGLLSFNVNSVVVSYYNDGPPFSYMGLGDVYDRWWTGGLLIGYYDYRDNNQLVNVELKFEKFTGWFPNSYEITKALGLHNVPYKDASEIHYNQSRIQLSGRFADGLGVHVSFYDLKALDLQDIIHKSLKMPLHPPLMKYRVGVGAGYETWFRNF